jgi:hypothetical protein
LARACCLSVGGVESYFDSGIGNSNFCAAGPLSLG